ncbi:MAG: phosphatase PAP2 family protein [Bacteroidota bacterium]|nr:phosphatase PAP2 family protein [Bacteroidota bacterium]
MQRAKAVAIFLIATLLLAIPALILLFTNEKYQLHAWLNSHHTATGDLIFSWLTHVADGWMPTLIAVLLLFFKDVRSFLMMGLSVGISAGICQLLKRMVFGTWDRPYMFKDELGDMAWVIGLDLNHHFSFPSGHATTAFSMSFALAVIVARSRWAIPFVALAVILAFSRVYLSQHFLEDITAGALLGIAVSSIFYLVLYKGPHSSHPRFDMRPFRRRQMSSMSDQRSE